MSATDRAMLGGWRALSIAIVHQRDAAHLLELGSDPRALAQLQGSVIEGLEEFEFSLYQRLGLAGGKGPSLGTRAAVPEEYRAAVEEYYRSLAGARRR